MTSLWRAGEKRKSHKAILNAVFKMILFILPLHIKLTGHFHSNKPTTCNNLKELRFCNTTSQISWIRDIDVVSTLKTLDIEEGCKENH